MKYHCPQIAWYKRHLLDLAYAGTIIFPVRIAQYYAAGERNLGKLLINSAIGTAIGLAITVPMLWVVDSYKELVGLEETGRLPKWIREKPLKSRKRIAAVYSAVGLAAALAVYILNPIKAEEKKAIPQLNKSELHEIIHTAAGI